MSSTKRAAVTALCIALSAVLPWGFHLLGLGSAFSPMHLPVLLCGLVCGPWYGLFCGLAAPVTGMLTTGMPSAAQLLWFLPELGAYGLVTGLLYPRLRTTRWRLLDLLLALLPAMVAGRVLGGLVHGLALGGAYSLRLWAAGYLIGTLPGAALQLAVLPALVLTLEKAGLIPRRTKA